MKSESLYLEELVKGAVKDCDEYRMQCEIRFNQCETLIKEVVLMQKENTKAVNNLIRDTRDIIQLHRDLKGAARIGNSLQNLAVWLAKWGTFGLGLSTAVFLFIEKVKGTF